MVRIIEFRDRFTEEAWYKADINHRDEALKAIVLRTLTEMLEMKDRPSHMDMMSKIITYEGEEYRIWLLLSDPVPS